MPDVYALGELLIDFVPTVTGVSLIEAPAFKKAPGGAPANVAVGLARLGVSSGFIGKVGDDAFGHFLAQTLHSAGVDVGQLRFDTAARTMLAFVSLRADGDREFMFYRHPSADMRHTPDDIDTHALTAARAFHFGSISLITQPARSATLHAVQQARDAGLLISYDPNLRRALWPSDEAARAGMLEGLQFAQVAKISDEELLFLTGTSDLKAGAQQLWHPDLRLLTVTYGGRGCAYVTPRFVDKVPGFTVTAVDTTGAGDGFVAGLLRGLLTQPTALDHEPTLRACCRFANAVGALATTERGAIPALPTLDRVEAFLAEQTA